VASYTNTPRSRRGGRVTGTLRPDRSRTVTAFSIAILAPPPSQAALPAASRDDRLAALTDRRSKRLLALLQEDPDRSWPTRDIARHLGDITLGTMYRQLSRWAKNGLILKIGPGLYTAAPHSSAPLPKPRERQLPGLGETPGRPVAAAQRIIMPQWAPHARPHRLDQPGPPRPGSRIPALEPSPGRMTFSASAPLGKRKGPTGGSQSEVLKLSASVTCDRKACSHFSV
jgi:hypothetical protein